MAGRVARKWNDKEIIDLLVLSPKEFCKKYKCTEATFFRAFHTHAKGKIAPPKENKKKSVFDEIEELLPSLDILINGGSSNYMKYLSEIQSKTDRKRSDLEHRIELESLPKEEVLKNHEMFKEVLIERRKIKDAIEFFSSNTAKLVSLHGLVRSVRENIKTNKSKIYKTRELKEEIGKILGDKKEG